MLSLNMVMIGTARPKAMVTFYEKVIGKAADWTEAGWSGWQVGAGTLMIGKHSEVKGKAKEAQRVILNFESKEVKKEFERIKALGAKVVKELYEMEGEKIATLADPDGNLFQIVSPYKPKPK